MRSYVGVRSYFGMLVLMCMTGGGWSLSCYQCSGYGLTVDGGNYTSTSPAPPVILGLALHGAPDCRTFRPDSTHFRQSVCPAGRNASCAQAWHAGSGQHVRTCFGLRRLARLADSDGCRTDGNTTFCLCSSDYCNAAAPVDSHMSTAALLVAGGLVGLFHRAL